VTARAIYANPADAFWSGSISDFAENGFSRYARHPDRSAATRTAGVLVAGHVDDRHIVPGLFERMPQLNARTVAQVDVEEDANRQRYPDQGPDADLILELNDW
jgi:hypothetical protein